MTDVRTPATTPLVSDLLRIVGRLHRLEVVLQNETNPLWLECAGTAEALHKIIDRLDSGDRYERP